MQLTARSIFRWLLVLTCFGLSSACVSRAALEASLANSEFVDADVRFALDREQTTIAFAVGSIDGQFNVVDAQLGFAGERIESATLDVSIATGSIDLDNPLLESMLRGEGWFASKAHPLATYKTRSLTFSGADAKVDGDLTIKGITHPIELDVHFPAGVPDLRRAAIDFTATGAFSRSQFDMGQNPKLAADLVELEVVGVLRRQVD